MTLDEINTELLACRLCPRLVAWREKVAREKRRAYQGQEYWGKPVPGFGDPQARVFVVGLAPGAHGSNRTGRQFTGDASGDFLYPALFRAGFASQPNSNSREDGLTLTNLYTAPVCRCAPPDNKPAPEEMKNCQPYLEREIEIIQPKIFVALGRIAFESIMRTISIQNKALSFAHNAVHEIPGGRWLVCSYHPSRQNTQTGRLTTEMFDEVWKTVRKLLED
ncbi:MAG: uracil-DNA glycosylase [Chloroflexi bacterium]|nr:uracil-DNA glycosylase [Chloroflexota bacterium]